MPSKISIIKEEIRDISSFINKKPKDELQTRLDRCLMCLGYITINYPEHFDEADFLKEQVWALIEKLSRRII
jgi:hypothetical protein